MNDIRYLIKFGEKKYMERFSEGHIYFSHAKKIREYEKHNNPKGQNDYLEGLTKLIAQSAVIQSNDDPNKTLKIDNPSEFTISYGNANDMVDPIPLFCLFACFDKDCLLDENNKTKIVLSEEIKKDIRAHFQKADTAVIIKNPYDFLSDIRLAFNDEVKTEQIKYFHIEEGLSTEDGKKVMEHGYINHMLQDSQPVDFIMDDGRKAKRYSFTTDNVYRVLLCKDVFFTNEQEYRILLHKKQINDPEEFTINFNLTRTRIVSMEDLFSEKIELS